MIRLSIIYISKNKQFYRIDFICKINTFKVFSVVLNFNARKKFVSYEINVKIY